MTFDINETRSMLQAVDKAYKPTTTLVNTFFPNVSTFVTNSVEIEYRKGGRILAPFVVSGSRGVNVARTGSKIRQYTPPMMKPKRVIEASDITRRGFGEDVYSTKTPEERAIDMRAKDLAELIDACVRTEEKMAAGLLINGEYDCKGFADDGTTELIDTVTFSEFAGKTTLTGTDTWDNASAKIYTCLGDASQTIRRSAGSIPTVAICSSNVVQYLLDNEQLYKYMLIPDKNAALMNLAPRLVSPELIRVGFVQPLNLEVYAYDGVFINESNVLEQYIPDNHIIIGVPGRGKRLYGAVTQLEADGQYRTYEGAHVPKIVADPSSDTSSLTVASRCVLCPEFVDEWATLKVK